MKATTFLGVIQKAQKKQQQRKCRKRTHSTACVNDEKIQLNDIHKNTRKLAALFHFIK